MISRRPSPTWHRWFPWWPRPAAGVLVTGDAPPGLAAASGPLQLPAWLDAGPAQAPPRACPDVPEPSVVPPPPGHLDPVLIRRSLPSLTPAVVSDFYGYLFAGQPQVRDMFPPQMSEQNERLFGALAKIAALLDEPTALAGYLAQLGADHRKYGVTAEHYAPVGDALLASLRRHCPTWTPATLAAWGTAYATAAQGMIAGAELQAGPARWTGEVVRHERRGADLAVLSVRTSEPLPYEAGQYVTVQSPRWPRVWRPFSIANAPTDGQDVIDLHVRAVPGGWVSTALTRDTRPGGQLLIGPPMGEMTAAAVDGRDLVCVAGGTGLAPIKALVEAILAGDEAAMAAGDGGRRNIALFHGARTPTGLYAAPELRALESSYPWLQFVPVVADGQGYAGLTGAVPDVAAGFADWAGREAFTAGPPGMVAETVCALGRAGLPADRVHYDAAELGVGVG